VLRTGTASASAFAGWETPRTVKSRSAQILAVINCNLRRQLTTSLQSGILVSTSVAFVSHAATRADGRLSLPEVPPFRRHDTRMNGCVPRKDFYVFYGRALAAAASRARPVYRCIIVEHQYGVLHGTDDHR
jgi:hypothetical protein